MADVTLTSIELIVPSGPRLAEVTPNWHVQIDGRLQSGYTTEEGLIFAAFTQQANKVVMVDQLPKIVMNAYESGLDKGASELSVIETRPNKSTGGEIRTMRIKAIIDHLLQPRRGPLSSNVYQFRSQPMGYLLCTDITTEEPGLEIIAEQSGKNEDVHAGYFVAQRKRRIEQELKRSGDKPLGQPKPKPQIRVFERGPAMYADVAKVDEITREKLLAILHGSEGSVTRSVELYYELVNGQGFSRRDADKLLNTIDRFIPAGYLSKAVDPDNNQHAIYIRTAEPLRKTQSS